MAARAVIGSALLPFTAPLFAADDNALTAPSTSSGADRDETALRLVNRDTPEARQQIKAALQNNGSAAAQIAVARALAQSPSPDSQLIPLLGGLLGPNTQLTEAAANALASYRQNPAAFDQLRHFIDAANIPPVSRIKAVRAVGNIVDPDKIHADYLINLMTQPGQNDSIRDAATEALGDLTGITDIGKDTRKWQQWWVSNQNKTPDQFKAMLLGNRVAQFNLLRQRNAQLVLSARTHLDADYNAAPVAAKDSIILGYLNDPAPEIRIVAVDKIALNASVHTPSPQVKARLTDMIGDSDAAVRLNVAGFIENLAGIDQLTVGPLLAQLAIEKDSAVKLTIAKALGKLQDPPSIAKAVPALITLLKSNDTDDLKAAAKAFTNLGEKLRSTDPAKADDVSAAIRTILTAPQNKNAPDDVRAACINALAALRDPKSFDTFMDRLNTDPSGEVREASLDGLGNLGDTRADQVVADQLNDRDPAIRLKAAAALRTVATQGFDQAIFLKMISNETEPDTRVYLWQAMQHLFDQESPAQLKHWATQFDKDPEKKLITLQKLGIALGRKGEGDEAAANEQDIAEAVLAVKQPGQSDPTAEQMADAIKHATIALNYWRQPGKAAPGVDERLETLIGQIMDYKLQSRNWTDATDFAAAQLAISPKYAEAIGPRIRDKIEALKQTNPGEAQKLIDAALAMKPPLDGNVLNDIRQMQNELKQAPPP